MLAFNNILNIQVNYEKPLNDQKLDDLKPIKNQSEWTLIFGLHCCHKTK